MQWSEDAQAALKKVPFFVRKRVRARVEKEAEFLALYKSRSTHGQRFAQLLSDADIDGFCKG